MLAFHTRILRKTFFKKALRACHNSMPRVITTDKYLNNIAEQNHRFIKKIVKPIMGFHSYKSACAILSVIEVMHMFHKELAGTTDVISESKLINRLLDVA